MKSFDELYKEFGQEDQLKSLWLEEERKHEKDLKKLSLIGFLIVSILFLSFFNSSINEFLIKFNIIPFLIPSSSVILIILAIFLVLICLLFNKNNSKYNIEFKNKVINKLIGNFYTDLEYYPNKGMPQRIYKHGFNDYYNRYWSDDYIEAKIDNNYFIEMAEVLTKKVEEEEDSDGKTHTTVITKFHGLFEKVSLDKSIKSELKIATNGSFRFDKKSLKMDSR